jgi:glycosyltransferase involved in cell wall biosynthesis
MKIIIIGENIKKALKNQYVGGAEKQTALLAKTLVSLNHHVCIMDSELREQKITEVDSVKVLQSWNPSKGFSVLRSLFYRLPSLYKKIKQKNPDIIYARGAGIYRSLIAFLFRKGKAKFVWGIAHDHDLQSRIRKINNATLYSIITNHLMFKLSTKILVHYAKAIICQTKEQENFLKIAKKAKRAYRIPNICEVSAGNEGRADNKKDCLWVGKFSGTKGEEEFLLLAKKMPIMNFIAVGHVTADFKNTAVYEKIINQPNIKCVGRLKYNELIALYQKVLLLVHTAPSEGFSNVFLEAWSFGMPVVSLYVDPDRLLQEEGLGYFSAGDIGRMKNQIEDLVHDSILRGNISAKSIDYVAKNHSAAIIGEKFNSLLMKLTSMH